MARSSIVDQFQSVGAGLDARTRWDFWRPAQQVHQSRDRGQGRRSITFSASPSTGLGRDAAGLLEWTASAAGRGVEVHVCARGRLDATSAPGFGTALGVGLADPYPAYLRHFRDRDVLNFPGVVLYGLRSSKSGRLPQKIIQERAETSTHFTRCGLRKGDRVVTH